MVEKSSSPHCVMDDPLLVGETSGGHVPKHLERVVRSVQDDLEEALKDNDLLVALIYTLILEIGFTHRDVKDAAPSYGPNYNKRKLRSMTCMPPNWRSPTGNKYTLCFHLHPYSADYTLQFYGDGVVAGTLIINVVLHLADRFLNRCVCVKPTDHVVSGQTDARDIYRKLSETSIWFKDLISPMRNAILEENGVLNPSLSGLPCETKHKICSYLSVTEGWKALSESCRDYYHLTQDQRLWRGYVKRDYGRSTAATSSQETVDWKEEYKKRHDFMIARHNRMIQMHNRMLERYDYI